MGTSRAPGLGIYCSSKWALEAMSQALAGEVAEFGIRVTPIEPGTFATGALSARRDPSEPVEVYAAAHDVLHERLTSSYLPGGTLGDPKAAADSVLAIVDADDPPLRVLFGFGGLWFLEGEYEARLGQWHASQPYSDLSAGRTDSSS